MYRNNSNYYYLNRNTGYYPFHLNYPNPTIYPYLSNVNWYRQQEPIRGQATWTEGGQVTKCGLPWSTNQYMTAAVGMDSPYKCGQTIKLRHQTSLGPKELIVTVVDQVQGYPPNRINLHRKAFEALGASPEIGVINIEIIPSPELEKEKWGKYLLEVTQTAYPNVNITEYKQVEKKVISDSQTKETYQFILESPEQGKITIEGTVTYNPQTDRVTSFDIKEV